MNGVELDRQVSDHSMKVMDGEKVGICMGGKVPLYYHSVQQPEEISGMIRISFTDNMKYYKQ